jgi:CBS-domain-containing membrane protein
MSCLHETLAMEVVCAVSNLKSSGFLMAFIPIFTSPVILFACAIFNDILKYVKDEVL